ncbi:hypothetical protein JW823_05480 [bacterium]|nr:hypothetical protein [candidate division CSSED10-310 bacterium]
MKCDRCGKELRAEDAAWRVHLTLTSDPDHGVTEYAEMKGQRLDDRLEALLNRIEIIPKEMLDDQIFQEFSHVVCSRCRGILAANPLHQVIEPDVAE